MDFTLERVWLTADWRTERVVVLTWCLFCLRRCVSVWNGGHHPLHGPDAEEEDCGPSSPDRGSVGVHQVKEASGALWSCYLC